MSSGAAQVPPVESPRAPTPSAIVLHGVAMAVGTSASSVPPPSQVNCSPKGVRAHSAAPLGHGPSSVTRTRASSVVSPCRGSNSAMGARARNAAPFNNGTGACDSHASPRHASLRKKAAVTSRRSHTQAGSSPLLPDHKEAVGLRFEKVNPNTPRCFARLDPVFLRDSSGRSILFPIKEESTSLATSPFSSKRTNGNDPHRARNMLPHAQTPLLLTRPTGPASSLGTLTYVHQATSAPVAQERHPTLRNEPVVTPWPPGRSTPWPPARSAGRYSRKSTEESRLSSRNSSEPPASSGAARAVSCDFTPKSDKATTRIPVGSDSRRALEAGCSQKGMLPAQSAEDWCSQTGTLQAHFPNTASDGLAP